MYVHKQPGINLSLVHNIRMRVELRQKWINEKCIKLEWIYCAG